MAVFNPLGTSPPSYFNAQSAKVYQTTGVSKTDPFYSSPLDVALSANSYLQKGDIYAAAPENTLGKQIAKDIQEAQTNSVPPDTPYTPSASVAAGSASITAMMASFTAQYQYSIDGQADPTYEALAQSVPSTFTALLQASRTSETTQLATIANSGADAATQAAQSAPVRIAFLSGAAFELQNGVNTPVTTPPAGSTAAASGPPDPVTSASALNDLVTELQTAVQEYSAGLADPNAPQDASFVQNAQSVVGTLQSVALALVPQMASDATPQYFNSNLYNATQNLTSIEATLQSLTGTSSASTPDSSSADLGNSLNTTA